MLSNKTSSEILSSEDFINLSSKAIMYNNIFIGEGFIITLCLMKILGILSINSMIWIIMKSMS